MPEEIVAPTKDAIVGHVADAVVKSYIELKETRTPANVILLGASSRHLGADDFRSIISSTEINGETIFTASAGRANPSWRKETCSRRPQLNRLKSHALKGRRPNHIAEFDGDGGELAQSKQQQSRAVCASPVFASALTYGRAPTCMRELCRRARRKPGGHNVGSAIAEERRSQPANRRGGQSARQTS